MTKKKAVTIVTPQALTVAQKRGLATLLEQKIGTVTPKYLVNPAIVGGLKITIDGQELDATLVSEVKNLRSQLPSVSIITAVKLTTNEQANIESIVNQKVGPADYAITIDPNILGGIKIIMDNQALRQVLLKKIAA